MDYYQDDKKCMLKITVQHDLKKKVTICFELRSYRFGDLRHVRTNMGMLKLAVFRNRTNIVWGRIQTYLPPLKRRTIFTL